MDRNESIWVLNLNEFIWVLNVDFAIRFIEEIQCWLKKQIKNII